MNYRELIERDGGFNLDPRTGFIFEPLVGYMVSLEGHTHKVPSATFSNDDVTAYLEGITPPETDLYLGAWSNDGYVFLDVSEQFQDRDEAIQAGTNRNQIAIWDVVNKREIPTGGDGS